MIKTTLGSIVDSAEASASQKEREAERLAIRSQMREDLNLELKSLLNERHNNMIGTTTPGVGNVLPSNKMMKDLATVINLSVTRPLIKALANDNKTSGRGISSNLRRLSIQNGVVIPNGGFSDPIEPIMESFGTLRAYFGLSRSRVSFNKYILKRPTLGIDNRWHAMEYISMLLEQITTGINLISPIENSFSSYLYGRSIESLSDISHRLPIFREIYQLSAAAEGIKDIAKETWNFTFTNPLNYKKYLWAYDKELKWDTNIKDIDKSAIQVNVLKSIYNAIRAQTELMKKEWNVQHYLGAEGLVASDHWSSSKANSFINSNKWTEMDGIPVKQERFTKLFGISKEAGIGWLASQGLHALSPLGGLLSLAGGVGGSILGGASNILGRFGTPTKLDTEEDNKQAASSQIQNLGSKSLSLISRLYPNKDVRDKKIKQLTGSLQLYKDMAKQSGSRALTMFGGAISNIVYSGLEVASGTDDGIGLLGSIFNLKDSLTNMKDYMLDIFKNIGLDNASTAALFAKGGFGLALSGALGTAIGLTLKSGIDTMSLYIELSNEMYQRELNNYKRHKSFLSDIENKSIPEIDKYVNTISSFDDFKGAHTVKKSGFAGLIGKTESHMDKIQREIDRDKYAKSGFRLSDHDFSDVNSFYEKRRHLIQKENRTYDENLRLERMEHYYEDRKLRFAPLLEEQAFKFRQFLVAQGTKLGYDKDPYKMLYLYKTAINHRRLYHLNDPNPETWDIFNNNEYSFKSTLGSKFKGHGGFQGFLNDFDTFAIDTATKSALESGGVSSELANLISSMNTVNSNIEKSSAASNNIRITEHGINTSNMNEVGKDIGNVMVNSIPSILMAPQAPVAAPVAGNLTGDEINTIQLQNGWYTDKRN